MRIEIKKSQLGSLSGYLPGAAKRLEPGRIAVLAIDDFNPTLCDVYEVDQFGVLQPNPSVHLVSAVNSGVTRDVDEIRKLVTSDMSMEL